MMHDKSALENLLQGDKFGQIEFLEMFIDEVDTMIANIDDICTNTTKEHLMSIHNMKSVAGYVGNQVLSQLACDLQSFMMKNPGVPIPSDKKSTLIQLLKDCRQLDSEHLMELKAGL